MLFFTFEIQETEKLIEQYKMEIMNLKENKTSIKESSESEQNQHLFSFLHYILYLTCQQFHIL